MRTLGSFFANIQSDQYRISHYLEIDPPSGPTITVSDTIAVGAAIVRAWGEIPPMLSEEESKPDAQAFDVELANVTADLGLYTRINEALAAHDYEGAECRLFAVSFLTDQNGVITGSLYRQQMFRGKIQQVFGVTQHGCKIRIAGDFAFQSGQLDHLVRDDFPQAPTEFASRMQPQVWGNNKDLPIYPIDVGVTGVLDADLASGATDLTLQEDIARWPSSGTIQIGGVEVASYSGVDVANKQLTGLDRGLFGTLDATHAAGTVVMQRMTTYRFLVLDPTYGKAGGVDAVRIAGKLLPANQWSFDTTTGILSITGTAGKRVGRPTYNRSLGLVNERMKPTDLSILNANQSNSFGPPTARMSRWSQLTQPKELPVFEAANLMLCAWAAPSNAHFWPCGTNMTYDRAAGLSRSLSTVELDANTPKTWLASWFAGYLPSSDLLVRESVVVSVTLTTAWVGVEVEDVADAAGGQPSIHMQPVVTHLRSVVCRIGSVERVIHLSGDDSIGAATISTYAGTTSSDLSSALRTQEYPQQHLVFDFGEDVDPALAPYDIELEALCDAGSSGRVAHVHALSQGVSGSTPLVIPTGVATAARDTPLPRAGIALTFPRTFDTAILTIAFLTSADYMKVDIGGGRIVRVTPPQQRPTLSTDSAMASTGTVNAYAFSTISILVSNPSSNMTVYARNFGLDNAAPAARTTDSGGAPRPATIRVLQATLAGCTAGSASYPLLSDAKTDSTFLAAFGEYPRADVRGYVGDGNGLSGTANVLLEHPADIIEQYLRRVMGVAAADTDNASFITARTALGGSYKFAGCIVDQGDRRVPLVWMMREARSWVQYDPMLGKWIMRYRESPAGIIASGADFAWTPAKWVDPFPELDRTADDKIVRRVNVRYLRDWSLPDELASYQAVASSGSGSPTRDDLYVAHFIRDSTIAQDLADFYAAWDGVALRKTTLLLLPSEMDAQLGDVATLSMPIGGSDPVEYLQGINGSQKYLVRAVGYNPGSLRERKPTSVTAYLLEVPAA